MPFEAKGCAPSLTDKIDRNLFLDFLREKHLEPRKAKLQVVVGNEHKKSLPRHQSIFEILMSRWLENLRGRRMEAIAFLARMPKNGEGF